MWFEFRKGNAKKYDPTAYRIENKKLYWEDKIIRNYTWHYNNYNLVYIIPFHQLVTPVYEDIKLSIWGFQDLGVLGKPVVATCIVEYDVMSYVASGDTMKV